MALAIFLPESITLLGGINDGVTMVRALCLAVLCLLFLGAALALMPGLRALPEHAAAAPPEASVAAVGDESAYSVVVNASSKADKLSIAASVDALEKVPVETIKITPVEVETQPQPRSVPKKPEVVGWHWHAGSKIKRRTNP
jgi:hypothetical protein